MLIVYVIGNGGRLGKSTQWKQANIYKNVSRGTDKLIPRDICVITKCKKIIYILLFFSSSFIKFNEIYIMKT